MTLLHNPTSAELRRAGPGAFEPLAPVLVSPEAQEIFAAYPEIEELYQLPVNLFDEPILTDETLKSNGVSREERRGNALEPSLHKAARRAFLSAAHILAPVTDPADRAAAFQFLVHEWEEDRQAQAEDQLYLRITLNSVNVDEGAAYIEGVNNHSQTVQQRMLENIKDSSANQYQLLKLLASVQSQEAVDDLEGETQDKDKQALRWLTLMALVGADRQHAPLADLLGRKLDQGEFDLYIARDMLEYASRYDAEGLPPEPVAALKSLISLVEHSAGTPADGQMLARMAEGFSLGMWPKEQQTAVYKQRKIILETLGFLFSVVNEYTAGVIAVEGRDYKPFLYKSFDQLADIETNSFIQTIRAVGETAAGSLKRRNQPKPEADEPSHPEPETSVEKEPMTLMCVDGLGQLHEADSKEFTDMVDAYLSKHENTPYLREDLEKILDYLTRLNFSNGRISGLIRVAEGYGLVVLNGGPAKPLPLWEFKPRDAAGLSLKSNAATRTRIILSHISETDSLAIRNIGRRTDSKARTLNKRSGRRRRH